MEAYGQSKQKTISTALSTWLNAALNRWGLPQQQQDASQLMGRMKGVYRQDAVFPLPGLYQKWETNDASLSLLYYRQKCKILFEVLVKQLKDLSFNMLKRSLFYKLKF